MSLNAYINSKPPPPPSPYPQLTSLPPEKVLLLTVDGRTLTGTLVSCDQVTNLVLKDTIERIIRPPDDNEPSAEQPHGLYLVRGDNVVVCGLVDEEVDGRIDWTKVRGGVVGGTKHV
ncbi:snRNP Sm protein [Saxophila tyrrhenica]|uniref:LSM2-LSM8 complex subunit LSM8 n=1 Tax=Saxophila tyrrhenica TaxID=1690608 RepID=A0AAV9P655_9PEZI|nr:snRNP Sm protein [Saxophila tyrrhenica]